jgi:hypothetical protein
MTTIFVVCGKVNYTNLSRYSDYCERTYRRHFEAGLGLEGLNQALIEQVSADGTAPKLWWSIAPSRRKVAATPTAWTGSTTAKPNGQNGDWNGRWSRSLIWRRKRAMRYRLNKPKRLGAQAPDPADESKPPKSRVDFYLGHLAYCTAYFPARIRYVVADGFYSKYKWVTGVVQLGFHAIGRLRSDANLKFLYEGPQKRRGTPSL